MSDFERVSVVVAELDLDTCLNTYGVAPCTAGRKNTGTAQAGTASTITLAALASAVDDAYKNMVVRITGGTGVSQERIITGYVGATKVATVKDAWTTIPDATSTYNVIDRPNACYNTFKTCQDKPNYLKGTKTYKFVTSGSPLQPGDPMRPYIVGHKQAPTEIDPANGLAQRASVSLSLADEPDADVETDPYLSNRASAPQGTFWTRWLARNHNYAGRFARLKRAYFTAGWDGGAFVNELYIMDSIKGPAANGDITVTLKDPIKLADRVKVPAPTSGKLAVALTTNDLQLTLGAGDGAQYPESGYVRVGEEVIQYTHKLPAQGWGFNDNTMDGWTTENATTQTGINTILVTAEAAPPQFRRAGLAINGGVNRYVLARIRRTIDFVWQGKLFYSTGSHGESGSFFKAISEPAGFASGAWVTAVWDMHNLTAGGSDWINNTIIGLNLDLTSFSTDGEFEIDWIGYGSIATFDADVLSLPNGTYRAQFGTGAQAAKIGDGIQLCKPYINQSVSAVIKDLLNAADIIDTYIDVAGIQAEDTNWLGSRFNITTCLAEPEDISAHLKEIAFQTGGVIWWSPMDQKVRYKFIGPQSPLANLNKTLTDEANFIQGTVKIESQDDSRLTFVAVYYDLIKATANLKEGKNFLRGEAYVDADAESANEYNDSREQTTNSRWFTAVNSQALRGWAQRKLGQYRNAPKIVEAALDPKDAAVKEGDIYSIKTAQIVDAAGAPLPTKVLILRRQDDGGRLQIKAMTTNFDRRYAFIAPNGTPDYKLGTSLQDEYAHIASNIGAMSDGSSAWLIV